MQELPTGDSLGLSMGLHAAHNLRDIGGYLTADGRRVRRNLVYRSDVLNPLNNEDLRKLGQLGLKRDYDLRTTDEISRQPDQIPSGVTYVHIDILADANSIAPAQLMALLRDPPKANVELGGGRIEAMFADAYRKFVSLPSARRGYLKLFEAIADAAALPGLYHCTTGKDRAGWATAALLGLLGVPAETIMQDYLRTNDYILPYYAAQIDKFAAQGGNREIVIAILGVQPPYLEAALAEMNALYGGFDDYFDKALGLNQVSRERLRHLLLE